MAIIVKRALVAPGEFAYFQYSDGSDPDSPTVGGIPVQTDPALVTTNTTLTALNSKTPALDNNASPVILKAVPVGTWTSRNGTTSGTPNTITQLMAAQSTRTEYAVVNLSEDYPIELFYGSTQFEVLDPGERWYRSIWVTGFHSGDRGQIQVRCPLAAGVGFLSWEVI